MKLFPTIKNLSRAYHIYALIALGIVAITQTSCGTRSGTRVDVEEPNFLVLMSDNHYFSHLGCYGDPVVKTPNIDAIAREGVRFTHAFCASPSCTPARSAILAGQEIWRLGAAANLHSTLSSTIPTYVDILEKNGYHVGHDRKGWGPGNYEAGGRAHNPAGVTYPDFTAFFDAKEEDKPWSFWLSSRNPHRPFDLDQGIQSGVDSSKVVVPPYLPNVPEVVSDICDYYLEVQDFDREVGEAIEILKQRGDLENTVIIICGDNGWMMPRGLANLYDFGTRVPFIISWPGKYEGNRVVDDLVSLNDIAATVVDVAGFEIPVEYTAASLKPVLESDQAGTTDHARPFVYMARERHALCRAGGLGYPGRAIRNKDFLFIQNLEPDRWPAGDPPLFGDIDLHMMHNRCPTKEYLMQYKNDPDVEPLYRQAFMKRPSEELFDLRSDPYQMINVADLAAFSKVKSELKDALEKYLIETRDPRMIGGSVIWDTVRYQKEKDWVGTPSEEMRQKFGFEKEYHYR